MRRKFKVTREDSKLFRSWIGTLDRYQENEVHIDRPHKRTGARQQRIPTDSPPHDALSEQYDPGDVLMDEHLSYARSGVQKSVTRKLRKGDYPLTASLDLHGLTTSAARKILVDFLHRQRRSTITCIKIIHGKGLRSANGGPILKKRVNHWLRQRDDVLAFESTPEQDGGTGALYVLLRAKKRSL